MRVSGQRPPEDTEIANACEEISGWAQEAGHPKTAVHFAELSAAIQPQNPYFAFVAGRANRIMGIPWRAEVFYSRAIRHAYRQLNWDVYVRAHLGYGRLLSERGRIHAAAPHLYSAARVAVDQGIDWLAAQTYHDLFAMHIEVEDYATAHVYAPLALATYPLHNERYPLAVHDYALLLVWEHHYAEAMPLLELVTAAAVPSHDQVIVWSTYGRTAGALGLADRFADAEARVLQLAPHYDLFAPAAFVNLALGARALADWQLAEAYVKRGIAQAEARADNVVLRVARELLAAIVDQVPAPSPAPPLAGEPAERLRLVLESATERLSAWHGETWTRKEQQSGAMTLGSV
jgi:tetratricopeptide (TPR) repeat protein